MQIFDASIMQWREQTEDDKQWAERVKRAAFPEHYDEEDK